MVYTWRHRSLGSCRYKVAHPGVRSDQGFPINDYTTESRRLARFFRFGHTPGEERLEPANSNKEVPFKLDLRY